MSTKCLRLAYFAAIVALICMSAADVGATILRSKVVDAETNEPIEGAVVAVVWWRPVFYPCMDSCRTVHDAAETVTDAQGNFAIDISMGLLAHGRNITIYRPGYYRPSYNSARWLTSPNDPPASESQVVRLIKAPSLQEDSKRHSYFPGYCAEDERNRQWCVPPSKVKNYRQITDLVFRLTDSGPMFPREYSKPIPLHAAALQGEFRTVRSLLVSGSNVDEQDKEGYTALMMAVENYRVDRSEEIIRRPRGMPDNIWQERLKILEANANRSNPIQVVRTLLNGGANPNLKSKNGATALSLAIATGREIAFSQQPGSRFGKLQSLELANALLKAGANPNIPNNDGVTPLMIAASRGLTEIVNALLAGGADVNVKANFGLTVFNVAQGDAVFEAINKARGPKKRLSPPPGTTPESVNNLMREAAQLGNASVVRALIEEEGANPNYQKQLSDETPLYNAIRSGDASTVETLLKLGANPNISVPHSGTPLAFATKALKPEQAARIIKALTDAGATENPTR